MSGVGHRGQGQGNRGFGNTVRTGYGTVGRAVQGQEPQAGRHRQEQSREETRANTYSVNILSLGC